MAQNPKRVVTELSKVWDQVVTKGKIMGQNQQQILKSVTDTLVQRRDELPKIPTGQELTDKFKDKVNKSMSNYEDFIGIKQVKEAHARVLESELKFVECQNCRRAAQTELSEVQNQLRLLRVEIDRTARGDERYLELIKKEIDVIREERFLRAKFEDLEKRERESFSELSNALRFSHEKERAQNEKTKYWSILGSIIGAFLGIVGTTINSRLKQQQTKAILSQTSAQVEQIEETVKELAAKFDTSLQIDKENSQFLLSGKLAHAFLQFNEAFEHRETVLTQKTDAVIAATDAVVDKLNKLIINTSHHESSGFDPVLRAPKAIIKIEKPQEGTSENIIQPWWVVISGVTVLAWIGYKFS